MQEEHASLFDFWNRYSTSKLIRTCDTFNEFRLFRALVATKECRSLIDLGCASGGFYRFFRKVSPQLEYTGFDISEPAIKHARSLYPNGDFRLLNGRPGFQADVEADVVFSRDVVHHQTDPCGFLSELYGLARRHILLRVRTREVGATVFDATQSCQYTYSRWVPYIVFNTSELTNLFRSFTPAPARITVVRHPVVLGGQHDRFLPKELYYPETGSAETALLVEKGPPSREGETVVTVEARPEVSRRDWLRGVLREIVRRVGS